MLLIEAIFSAGVCSLLHRSGCRAKACCVTKATVSQQGSLASVAKLAPGSQLSCPFDTPTRKPPLFFSLFFIFKFLFILSKCIETHRPDACVMDTDMDNLMCHLTEDNVRTLMMMICTRIAGFNI